MRISSILGACVCCLASSLNAAEGGYSNYLPGSYGDFAAAVEPTTDLSIRNDLYRYQADDSEAVRSGLITTGADLELFINQLTVLYTPGIEIFGAQYGIGVVLPLVYADLKASLRTNEQSRRVQDDVLGFGDATLVPGILFWDVGNYHFTVAEYIVTPTGGYDSDDLINTSLNYWTFDTNVATTYLNEETGQDYSINVGYTYNTENSDTDYQTGQELHIDFMLNQFFSESFAIGLQGFYLKQVSGDSGGGALLGGFKAEAAGIGPAVLWTTSISGRHVSFIAKWLHEYHAHNRMEGDHIYLSFAMGF